MKICFNILAVFCLVVFGVSCDKKVVCYYGTWATYRHGLGQFNVEHINADLCTHVIYTFVGLNAADGTVVSLDPYLDLPDNYGRDNFRKFNELKLKNANLKTILAVGGWNEGSAKYSVMAASAELRQKFVQSSLEMLLEYGFDGYDIDWEYPNKRDSVNGEADIENFSILLKDLKASLSKHGLSLSFAASAVESAASTTYDIKTVIDNVDFINLMTYDFYGAWDTETGHNAPLHKSAAYPNKEDYWSVDLALKYWINAGCPPEKLILGVPLYGRTFYLTNANNFAVGAPSNGPGITGPFTATSGSIGYNELCAKFISENWTTYRDAPAKVPYAVQNTNWVSYDDPESIKVKVEYAMTLGLGGAMVWSIETDDFHGTCHGIDFPLLRAINSALGKSEGGTTTTTVETSAPTEPTSTTTAAPTDTTTTTVKPTTTTDAPTITEPTSTTTEASTTTESTTTVTSSTTEASSTTPVAFSCDEEGFAAHPDDCSKFIRCIKVYGTDYLTYVFQCPTGLLWDQTLNLCNYAEVVECV